MRLGGYMNCLTGNDIYGNEVTFDLYGRDEN
jgi:hypothetical protein